MEDNLNLFLQMEDDLNSLEKWKTNSFLSNGRRPQYFGKWKTISKFSKWKTTSILWQMEDDLNTLVNGRRLQNLTYVRRLQYFGKWMKTSTFWHMEDDLNMWTY